MQSFAQSLFLERERKPLIKTSCKPITRAPWPFLHTLLIESKFEFIDYALAESFLQPFHFKNQNIACLISFLSLASRHGHLCIKIDSFHRAIYPDPVQLWNEAAIENDRSTPSKDQIEQFTHMMIQAIQELPNELVTPIHDLKTKVLTPICRWNDSFYIQRFWHNEASIINNYKRLQSSQPTLIIDPFKINQSIDHLLKNKKLTEEQAQGLLHVLQDNFSIICGGPGTGKTYLAAILVQIFWEALSEKQKKNCEIALAAPTGKAATNLLLGLQNVIQHLQGSQPILAKTLHAWLDLRPGKENETKKVLSADLIIVDESSMIDQGLMAHLFAAVKEGARLILIGDQHQLPPVEAGSPFKDLIQLQQTANKTICNLKTCLRSEIQSIVNLAKEINQGNCSAVLQILKSKSNEVLYSPLPIQKNLLEQVEHIFSQIDPSQITAEYLFKTIRRFCLLSPLRQGPFGVDTLNQLLFKHSLKQAKQAIIIPIIITRNDKRFGLHNGDVGLLIHEMEKDNPFIGEKLGLKQNDYALFSESGKNCHKIPAILLPRFDYAYCLSVHKSQGSEFDHVTLLLPEGSEIFGREMFYTAVTRARQNLQIYSSDATIQAITDLKCNRLTSF